MSFTDWLENTAYFRQSSLYMHHGDRPVFHKSRLWDDKIVDGPVITIPAVCGLALNRWNRETGAHIWTPVVMKREYAESFARPCTRCWDV